MLTDAETPAAGPDIAITSGRRFTAEIGIMAPAEWNTCRPGPIGRRCSSSLRYSTAIGIAAALNTVAEVRSYSRASGLTSCDSETWATTSLRRSPSIFSCTGLA
ncbi:hypothetical protein ABH990_004094 [Bradyrhizobium ottawaense]